MLDSNKWETNRMINSGAVKIKRDPNETNDLDEDDECRVLIQVNDIKPPFLDGRIIFTTQMDPIQIVRDPNSEMSHVLALTDQVFVSIFFAEMILKVLIYFSCG
jgi:pre-mRNA-splicing factor ATP-dependent RNA helicase DHX38/PRP16